ncbi:D-cysteine desulfhydrase [Candidatus Ornithobacterium hominis]|uniref:D-cysteine desulfhydrase n=1 Tax=Candidatus Ornithobacterium hominis TaxID=2497989 RepID=A0A383TW50_9FLAO|nr:pyridoxal-phosphate dependent enzyme [Candidatus Ornithobacterium hominis]MCT7903702.1 pyridoxal-phosphate dependent enzyme [Candidatus Ornithobacterium hominis]SZD71043.1 D-cysteine desulfhydrase [Candidatus Ornithobacterium hominis]SZD71716.1 D-cysteine desulfhydrase [Candidatus Ornithobacterium hominis]
MNLAALHNISPCPIQNVNMPLLEERNIKLDILREDMNHPLIQGNKLRKLKYNILEAHRLGFETILSFGGAFSNHISALAAAGKAFGFNSIGVIRGDELTKQPLNVTLKDAQERGMKLDFVSRSAYRSKNHPEFIKTLKNHWGNFFIVPEGGSNELGVKGVTEMVDERFLDYDFITTAVGSGGTLAGILQGLKNQRKVLGFPALRNADYLKDEIGKWTNFRNYEFINTYHFGGFGKIPPDLVTFAQVFYECSEIVLDPLYTSKMFYGLIDLIEKNYFKPGTRLLAIHTGGLQGISGVESRMGNWVNRL